MTPLIIIRRNIMLAMYLLKDCNQLFSHVDNALEREFSELLHIEGHIFA
jgi:hypothetical protein